MRSGVAIACRPLIVARTRLIGLREPTALASTFFTPTTSSTARIAPPAITPVPSEAGCMNTRAAPRAFHGLGNGHRHFTRLAIAETDLAVAVADHGQRGEAHLPTALDRLGHAVDGDEFFQHAVTVITIVA